MSGLTAQLDFIRQQYPNVENICIVSDKCSNFNSFEQIPFLIAGNQQHWVFPDRLPEPENTVKDKKERAHKRVLLPLEK